MTPFQHVRIAPEGNLLGGRIRFLAAMSMAGLLAACSSNPEQARRAPSASFAAEAAAHPQPASYDPPGPPSDPWGPYIREASKRFDIPDRWIREVMRQESGGRVNARSPVGAMGLMQVMPGTYAELRARYGLGEDAYHPWNSIMSGTAYLREMYELYGSPGFLAAYNGGPRRLEEYLWSGKNLPAETRNYVARIGPRIEGAHPNRRAAPEIYAAAELPLNIPPGPRRGNTATMLALREQRNAVDPGVRVATLPAGPVVRMDPIPDGSTYTQVASLEPSAGTVVRMEPIPDGSTYRAPSGGGSSDGVYGGAAALPMPAPAAPAAPIVPVAGTSIALASLPMPAPPAPAPSPVASPASSPAPAPIAAPSAPPPVAPVPSLLASANAAPARAAERPSAASVVARYAPKAEPAQPQPQQLALAETPRGGLRGFSLVGVANASTLPAQALRPATPAPKSATPAALPSGGSWGVQVGAFANTAQARSAADEARGRLRLGNARTTVESVAQGRNTLYRARVMNLSREDAQSACEKLRSRGACIIVSPG